MWQDWSRLALLILHVLICVDFSIVSYFVLFAHHFYTQAKAPSFKHYFVSWNLIVVTSEFVM